MNELENFFAETTRTVDEKLDLLIPSAEIVPQRLYEAVRWSIFAGGKRFRPALVLAVGRAFGANDKSLLQTACAFEMIHTYSLIHDDLPAMDDDNLRRGRETCHIKFDEATAILAGDVLQTLAFQAITKDENLPDKIKVKIIAELADAAAKMVDGQQLDLDGEGKKITLENLERIHQNKTGAMISASAKCGAIIAEASEDEIKSITNYGSKIGLLFQITDDLLDITQTTEVLGKTAGKDLTAEKSTYPGFYGIAETRKLAEKVHAEAVGNLKNIDRDTMILRKLADFILSRQN